MFSEIIDILSEKNQQFIIFSFIKMKLFYCGLNANNEQIIYLLLGDSSFDNHRTNETCLHVYLTFFGLLLNI